MDLVFEVVGATLAYLLLASPLLVAGAVLAQTRGTRALYGVILVLFTGPIGLVFLLFYRTNPSEVAPCPTCGHLVASHAFDCSECGQRFFDGETSLRK